MAAIQPFGLGNAIGVVKLGLLARAAAVAATTSTPLAGDRQAAGEDGRPNTL